MSGKNTVKKNMNNVNVEVLAAKFGTYKKGDEVVMHKSTADACEKRKIVKILGPVNSPAKAETTK